jgi:hypothetical protein
MVVNPAGCEVQDEAEQQCKDNDMNPDDAPPSWAANCETTKENSRRLIKSQHTGSHNHKHFAYPARLHSPTRGRLSCQWPWPSP